MIKTAKIWAQNKSGVTHMEIQSLCIKRLGSKAFLEIGNSSVEIQDYKISNSMQGSTELEVTFKVDSCIHVWFEVGAEKESI